ncbi:OLC1v1003572C1 [Oldenlandia corymbosa var. corymbosa]|uniref:OLC1v1003572C1 n=1 Tax=Oldenlandia corymbosa var. corymbosa TaxID=529605 RepID=A0AAV1DAC0_OLDCO|nr:OLC1v1003572C1 [Oldenlandia corymbosa var. corymbosa]
MGVHQKSDSEVTSCIEEGSSTPPRSPGGGRPPQPLYYVQSPSSHNHHHSAELNEKMSYGSSPFASPPTHHHHYDHYYHCSPIHHSRDQSSTTSRFSASLKNPSKLGAWQLIPKEPNNGGGGGGLDGVEGGGEDDEEDDEGEKAAQLKFYVVCFLLGFVLLFTLFSLILWGASLSYQPNILVKKMVFERMKVQAGIDGSGVPTDMLTLNSTVKIVYSNPSTFFGLHVTSTPLQLRYLDLILASGPMKKFYESRKSQRIVAVVVQGYQVPLYGGVPVLSSGSFASTDNLNHNTLDHSAVSVPMNLTFQMRSRAYILGRLVKPKFYKTVLCQITVRPNHLGRPISFTNSNHCVYR